MQTYQKLVRHVLDHGSRKENRTGVDTLSTFNFNYEVAWEPRLYPQLPTASDLVDLIDVPYGMVKTMEDFEAYRRRPGVPFPILTTKDVSFKNILVELLWFLSGSDRSDFLDRHGCKFWKPWTDESGKVMNCYGPAWRKFPVGGTYTTESEGGPALATATNDQIPWAIEELKRNPLSRRVVLSAWAPAIAQKAPLPPCHVLFVFNVQNAEETLTERFARAKADLGAEGLQSKGIVEWHQDTSDGRRMLDKALRMAGYAPKVTQHLCLHLTQRSCDVALGVPYNLSSYALLLLLVSRFTGIKPGIFAHTLIDAHIYTAKPDGSKAEYDHVPGLITQLGRKTRPLPKLIIDDSIQTLADVERLLDPSVSTDELLRLFKLEGYDPHPAIPFRVAVLDGVRDGVDWLP